jgi:hypothetical protein
MNEANDKLPTVIVSTPSSGYATFARKMVNAPALCKRCNTPYVSPTTGVVWNECHCGGELVEEATWHNAKLSRD